jgi:hypothetical protein
LSQFEHFENLFDFNESLSAMRQFAPVDYDYALVEALRLTIEKGRTFLEARNEKLNIFEKIDQLHNKTNEMLEENESKPAVW